VKTAALKMQQLPTQHRAAAAVTTPAGRRGACAERYSLEGFSRIAWPSRRRELPELEPDEEEKAGVDIVVD